MVSRFIRSVFLCFNEARYVKNEVINLTDGFSLMRLDNNPPGKSVTLIISGGFKWNGHRFYNRILGENLKTTTYVLYSEKYFVLCEEAVKMIHEALTTLRLIYPEHTINLTGISIGGYMIGKYLSYGYDDADYYFPCNTNWCFQEFNKLVPESYILSIMKKRFTAEFRTAGYLELQNENIGRCYYDNLKEYFLQLPLVQQMKVTFILSDNDAVNGSMIDFIVRSGARFHIVKHGHHACPITLLGISDIINRY